MLSRPDLERGTSFGHETFEGLDLQRLELANKEFYDCTFRHVKLQESVWRRARFEDCVFEDCDLTQMKPGDAGLHDVHFVRCKLMGVGFTKSVLNARLSFEECSLRYASFTQMNLRDTTFVRCKLVETSFVGVDLSNAQFTGSDASGAVFEQTVLAGADFTGATNAFIDPAKNRVKGARVSADTAALLAMSFGMRVEGYSSEND